MDTEEGREVVWNEVQFSEKKNFKEKEVSTVKLLDYMHPNCSLLQEQIHQIFDNLINLHHPSILKFHRWWTDVETVSDKTRVSEDLAVQGAGCTHRGGMWLLVLIMLLLW